MTGTPVPPVPEHLSRGGPVHRPVPICTGVPASDSEIGKAILAAADRYTRAQDANALSDSERIGRVIDAIWGTLRSSNEPDSNVADGLFAIAKAIDHLARAHEGVRTAREHDEYHDPPDEMPLGEDRGRVRLRGIPDQLLAPVGRNGGKR